MKNIHIALPVIAGLFFLSACQQQQSDTPESTSQAVSIDKKDAVASVNGAFISKAALEELKEDVAKRSGGQTFPDEQLLDELIKRELLLQEARQKKLAERPDVKKSLMTMQNSVMTQAAIQDYLNTNDVTEDELKAEYDKKIG
ncbi:MAG: peptidylprolyl isomerase, partial [Gammaproteobacteria bacterium]